MNWLKQTSNEPLFGNLLWSRPENRRYAGKLLVIGGNAHAVTAPGIAYSAAELAGIGVQRVALPDATQKLIGKVFPEAEFAPSTRSGSFSREALAVLVDSAFWADGVLLAGDFGKNSETAILLESFLKKYTGLLCLTDDALDYFIVKKSFLLERKNTVVVASFTQIQKLAQLNHAQLALKNYMSLHNLVEALSEWSGQIPLSIVTLHSQQIIAASGGKASTTPAEESTNWQINLAAYAATWLIQQPKKPFEALTTAVFDFTKTTS